MNDQELIQKILRAIVHAHEWLERVEQRRVVGYFGLDHSIGGNVDGCDLCAAWLAAQHGAKAARYWTDAEIDAATDEVVRRGEDELQRRGG